MAEGFETEFWGEALTTWPSDVVARMGITGDDASYLNAVGLPTGVDWSLEIALPSEGSAPQRANGMPALAFDGSVPICVDTKRLGMVVAVEGEARRLVNSSVRRFGAFLMIYQDYRLRVAGLDEAEATMLIDEIERRMKETDREVMQSGENYWPVIVEQMRDGLL